MKRNLFGILMVLTLFVGFSSCSKDDDEDSLKGKIIGKWNVTDWDTGSGWKSLSTNYMWIQFYSDDKYTSKEGSSTYSGTYTITGMTINGDVSGYITHFNIIELNGNNAILEVDEQGYKPYKLKATRQ